MKFPNRRVLILTQDPYIQTLLEMTIREFNFLPRLIQTIEQLPLLSTTIPVVAWFVDLDTVPQSVGDIVAFGRKKAPEARLVFLSSKFTLESAAACMHHDALALLLKPIMMPRLVETFHQISIEPILVDPQFQEYAEKDPPKPAVKTFDHPLLRIIDQKCPVCTNAFKATRFKLWKFPISETDTDFCPISPNNVHPELYSVIVCPTCLFSSYVGSFSEENIPEVMQRRFLSEPAISERRVVSFGLDFRHDRSHLHGTKSFELAAIASLQLGIRNSLKFASEYYLKSSWLCRRLGHPKAEQESQRRARDLLIRVCAPYKTVDGAYPGQGTIFSRLEPGMDCLPERGVLVSLFLLGELSRRLGDIEMAAEAFRETLCLPFFVRFTSLMRHVNAVVNNFEKQYNLKVRPGKR
ncbi:MAG: DUF2225 domain-containing protein [Candidatus Riflebacteria bacterium]|nr:DUF2225 domain-containing protein [Candidatus Riflebacteria bacterium]